MAESDTETVDSQVTVEGGIAEGIDKTMDMFMEKEGTLRKAKSEHKVIPRNTMSKIVAGKEIDERVLEKMSDHVRKQGMKSTNTEKKGKRVKGAQQKKRVAQSPQPGPSRIITSDTDSDNEVGDTELCCQCKRYTPAEMSRCLSIVFAKWGQCDTCGHWTHLIYCSTVRVLRRSDVFTCPCCVQEE